MIEEITEDLTALDYTNDLRERLINDEPYDVNVPYVLLPLEPLVIVDEINEDFTNHRAFEKDGKWIVPIATYINGSRQAPAGMPNGYTKFDEVKLWSEVYGIENVYVDVIANLHPQEDIE